MYEIAKLVWVKRDLWVAETPASYMGHISISFEEGKYWSWWDCNLPGFDKLEDAMKAGQEFHETFIKQYLV